MYNLYSEILYKYGQLSFIKVFIFKSVKWTKAFYLPGPVLWSTYRLKVSSVGNWMNQPDFHQFLKCGTQLIFQSVRTGNSSFRNVFFFLQFLATALLPLLSKLSRILLGLSLAPIPSYSPPIITLLSEETSDPFPEPFLWVLVLLDSIIFWVAKLVAWLYL